MNTWRILIAFAALGASAIAAGSRPSWQTCESYTPIQGEHHKPFEIGCWGDDGGQLFGFFGYTTRRYPDDTPASTLRGRSEGKSFRPNVRLQISHSWKGPWKTVRRLHVGDHLLTVDRMGDGTGLEVELEAFRPYLRKFQCGRVVLETGEAARVYLDDLIPEKDRPKHAE